jgi:hypothetical protein
MKHVEITPELTEEMVNLIDLVDTALLVICINDEEMVPSARKAARETRIAVQNMMVKLKGKDSLYAQAVQEARLKETQNVT